MKKFSFKLEKLLSLKKANEEKAKRAFLWQLKKLDDACALLKSMQHEQQQFIEAEKGKRTGVVDIKKWRNFNSFISLKKIKEMEQSANVNIENFQLAYKKNDYIKVSRDKKVIEKLKEEEMKNHKKGYLKEEQRIFDNIAGQRFLRNDNS